MILQFRNGDEVPDSVGLLISMLVRYPEIGTINYDSETNSIKITFIMLKTIPEQDLEDFRKTLLSCLEAFHFLEQTKIELMDVNYSLCEDITILEYKRDVKSLTSKEISLTISVVRNSFPEYLMNENQPQVEEDQLLQEEEIIGKMLENIKYTVPDKKLIAFREEGRVLIFNK